MRRREESRVALFPPQDPQLTGRHDVPLLSPDPLAP
jgi:hypothetical protein